MLAEEEARYTPLPSWVGPLGASALEERKLIREIAKLGASDELYAVLDELRE